MTSHLAMSMLTPAMRESITRTDELVRERIAEFLAAGIEDGSIREIDVEETARFLFVLIEAGALFRTSNGRTEWMESVRTRIDVFLDDIAAADET